MNNVIVHDKKALTTLPTTTVVIISGGGGVIFSTAFCVFSVSDFHILLLCTLILCTD